MYTTALTLLVHRCPALRRRAGGDGEPGLLASQVTTGLALLALALGVGFRAVNFYALLLLLLTRPLVWLIRAVIAKGRVVQS